MEKHLRNSWKLFSITLMLCCTSLNCLAEDGENLYFCPVIPVAWCTPSETPDQKGSPTTVTICPSGSYVQKCGDYTIGYEWIKTASTIPIADTTHQFNLIDNTSNNQYGPSDYFEQMRRFFAGTETKTIDGTADARTVIPIRDTMLNTYCHPDSVSFTCAKCPNNAKIAASSVKIVQWCYKQVLRYSGEQTCCQNTSTTDNRCLDENDSLPDAPAYRYCSRTQDANCYYQIDNTSWEFHTIADCYENEFDDDTGTFVYLPEGTSTGSAKCYYGNTVSESDFNTYFMGTEPGSLTVNSSTNTENDTGVGGIELGVFPGH